MGQFRILTKKQILTRMINRVVARSDLVDMTDTSSVKQVLDAAAREDDDQYYQMTRLQKILDIDLAYGPDLDRLAVRYNRDLLSRDLAQKATSYVVFGRTNTTGAKSIAIGTEVKVPGTSLVYATTEEGSMADGVGTSNNVAITAKMEGSDYNVDPDTITGFSVKPSGIDTVTNPAKITNGLDEEKDDSFRNRIKLYVKSLSRGTVSALTYAALTAIDSVSGKRVLYANVIEDVVNRGDVTIYIDDGSGTAEETDTPVSGETVIASAVGGEVDLYTQKKPIKLESGFTLTRTGPSPAGEPSGTLTIDTHYTLNPASGHIKLVQSYFPNGLPATSAVTSSYTPFKGLIQECQKVIDGDPNDWSTYPGYRAAGVLVRVLSPDIIQMSYAANITVLSGFSQTDIATKIRNAVSGYVNALGIGEDVILNELRERSMSIPGMYDIIITSPTANRIILDNQLARIISSNISVV
jgi:uncharacterized phage protein gp47/JayE